MIPIFLSFTSLMLFLNDSFLGLYSGINPDTPRNLAKAVTVD